MATQQTFMYFYRLFCLSALLLLARFGIAQENLILNPSFEQSSSIPNSLGQYHFCEDWWDPSVWSTDYYTSLTNSSNQNFIPTNFFGNQDCSFGNYYLGIILVVWQYSLNDFSNFRVEYAAGKFLHTLEKDKIYQFEFWISKAEKGLLKTNAIDLIITYDTIVDVNNFETYGYKLWSESTPMDDTLNWVKISTCFKAKGNEKAFVIGNFHQKNEVIKVLSDNPVDPAGELDYRYLDNFSLIECPSCCPDQFEDEPLVYVSSNPSTSGDPGIIELWLHPNTTGNLKLYDAAGRLKANESYSSVLNVFLLNDLAKGLYQYVYQTSDGVLESGKVLIAD